MMWDPQLSCSREESHVSSSNLLVWVSNRGQHPLSHVPSGAVCAEEVVEHSWVERPDCLISEVIVVGLDLWALVVVRLINHSLDHLSVAYAKLLHCGWLALQMRQVRGGQQSLELLLLVSVSVFLHDDFHRKLLQELVLESIGGILLHTWEVRENFFSLSCHWREVFESLSGAWETTCDLRELSKEDFGGLVLSFAIWCPCRASLSFFGSEFGQITESGGISWLNAFLVSLLKVCKAGIGFGLDTLKSDKLAMEILQRRSIVWFRDGILQSFKVGDWKSILPDWG